MTRAGFRVAAHTATPPFHPRLCAPDVSLFALVLPTALPSRSVVQHRAAPSAHTRLWTFPFMLAALRVLNFYAAYGSYYTP